MQNNNHDKEKLYDAIDALESQALVFGRRFINDSRVRSRYKIDIGKFGNNILHLVENGSLTKKEGAQRATIMRNFIMQQSRLKASEVSNAFAKSYKKVGKTQEELELKYSKTKSLEEFSKLPEHKKNKVWLNIIEKSMNSNPDYDKVAKLMSHGGRVLMITTVAIAIYKVAKAKNKVHEAAKQGVILLSAYTGSEIGGTIGSFGGPFDPITVPLGVFLGGIIGASVGAFTTKKIDKI